MGTPARLVPNDRQPPIRTVLYPITNFLHNEAAGGIILIICALIALDLGQLALGRYLHQPLGDEDHDRAAHREPAALDQRRADGRLLLRGRPGDQARGAGRGAGLAPAGGVADRRRARGDGGPGPDLRRDQSRRAGDRGLGDPDGDRYRLLARRPRPPGEPRADRAEDLPRRPRHRGRPGGGAGDRLLLHQRHRLGRPGGRRALPGAAGAGESPPRPAPRSPMRCSASASGSRSSNRGSTPRSPGSSWR